jgi:hypothetical protein
MNDELIKKLTALKLAAKEVADLDDQAGHYEDVVPGFRFFHVHSPRGLYDQLSAIIDAAILNHHAGKIDIDAPVGSNRNGFLTAAGEVLEEVMIPLHARTFAIADYSHSLNCPLAKEIERQYGVEHGNVMVYDKGVSIKRGPNDYNEYDILNGYFEWQYDIDMSKARNKWETDPDAVIRTLTLVPRAKS